MKKTILALALLSTFASCKKDIGANTDTNNTSVVNEKEVLGFQSTNNLTIPNMNGIWGGFYGSIPSGTWQYLWANSQSSWGATAYLNGNGVGVYAYPSARRYYGYPGKKWTDFNQFISSVTFTNPQANGSTVGLSYNTSYDYFFYSGDGQKVYEIMVWLNAEGQANNSVAGVLVANNLNIGDYNWKLYKASGSSVGNGYRTVWSFVRNGMSQNDTQTFYGINMRGFTNYLNNSGLKDTGEYDVNIPKRIFIWL